MSGQLLPAGGVQLTEKGEDTRVIRGRTADAMPPPQEVLFHVYHSLQEKGYDPMRQIAYYLLTGEPAYITAHQNARSLMTRIERDEIVEELVRFYLTGQRG